jgi:heme oxygenase
MREALRHATDATHQRLHGHRLLARLADGTISRPDYALLLRQSLAFHAVLEDRLERGPALDLQGIDLVARSRSSLLQEDLAALGVAVPPVAPPAPRELAVPGSAAAALGYLYVSEGSRMGGLAMARSLDGLLGPGSPAGRRFLLGYGPTHGAQWRALCDAIEAEGHAPESRDAMLAAAVEAFLLFEACMDPAVSAT